MNLLQGISDRKSLKTIYIVLGKGLKLWNLDKETEQAGAKLGQAQLPTGILLYCD